MKPALASLSLFALSSLLAAQAPLDQSPGPALSIDLQPERVEFAVSGLDGVFLGGVILSLQPDLVHYFEGLPPLLADFVVLGVGVAHDEYRIGVPVVALPPGLQIYAQGVVADVVIESTAVGSFVLDAMAPR